MTPQQKIGTLVAMTVFGMLVGGALPLMYHLARRRRERAATDARRLLLVLGLYAAVLVATSLLTPRHVLAPGQPDCYGDWCVAGGQAARLAPGSARCGPASGPVWRITLEIFTQSWASPQRASSATVAAIEDRHGLQYAPCGEAGAETAPLARHLDPGESYTVTVAVAMPPGHRPAGAVVRNRAFPASLVLGSEGAVLHTPALLRLALREPPTPTAAPAAALATPGAPGEGPNGAVGQSDPARPEASASPAAPAPGALAPPTSPTPP